MKWAVIDDRYMPFRSSCTGCKHFDIMNLKCPAYPNGIPTNLLTGDENHLKVRKDQVGKFVREVE